MATAPFAAPLYPPKFRAFDANGDPLAGGKVNSYIAGTSTPLATYPTYADALAGTNANANPTILDANGEASIFLQNTLYKIILQNSANVTQWTLDSVGPALGFPSPYTDEWTQETNPVVYSSAVQFTITGVDRTAFYHAGRRVKTTNTGGTRYSTVSSSSFGTNTTVNLVNDSGTLDAGLSAVYLGWTSYVNASYLDPRSFFSAVKSGNQTGFAASTKVATWTVEEDAQAEWVAGTNRWVCKYPGKYVVMASAEMADTGTNVAMTLQIAKNAGVVGQTVNRSSPTASQIWGYHAHYLDTLAAGDFIEVFVLGSANTTVQGTIGTRFSIVRQP